MSRERDDIIHPGEGPGSQPGAFPPRVGVDVGGTFTDLVYSDGHSLRVVKVPSTPPAFEQGVSNALAGILGSIASPAGEAVSPGVLHLIHGSTIATNALLERKGAAIAFITTRGFRDLLLIGRQNRPELYNLHVRRPPPIVPRENCFAVPERIGPGGQVITPLDEREVEEVARKIVAAGIRHVAICFLFSFANPSHERRAGEVCRRHGLTVTLSSDIVPEFREYERASTTAVTASLRPTVERYLGSLQASLPPAVTSLRIVHGGGGTYPVPEAIGNAGRLALSGPAGGAAGAALMARIAGFPDAVGFDMGGTSTDVTLIRGGQAQTAQQHVFDGIPVHLPMLDIHTVGAGGGSVAYLDAGGSLRVGPRSAGAQPGPACYGRGGKEPTVTDANVVLGRIPTNARFGELQLQPELASDAIDPMAARLDMTREQAALGILKVAEQNMAGAVRVVTARRGHDPRRLALVSFGGAGGLHACAVAELLGMKTVILPPMAGVLSALGMVAAGDSVEVSQTVLPLERDGTLDDARLAAEFARLDDLAERRLPEERTAATETFADCRWDGQSHELTIRASRSRKGIEHAFTEAYRTTYGPHPPERAVQIVTLRLRRTGPAPAIHLEPLADGPSAAGEAKEIELVDDAGGRVMARSIRRSARLVGEALAGPLLLVDPDATAFVPAGWRMELRSDGIAIASRKEAR